MTPTLQLDPHESTHRKVNPGIITEPHTEPAWNEIEAALDGHDTDESQAATREQIARVLQSVLAFITAPADARQGETLSLYGRRAVALRLALQPDSFRVSARKLAGGLGVCPVNLCRLGKQAEKAFGLRPTKENRPDALLKGSQAGSAQRFVSSTALHVDNNSTNKEAHHVR